jgi:hypothetical protein
VQSAHVIGLVEVLEAEPRRIEGDVLLPEQVRLKARGREQRRRVGSAGIEVPIEAMVCQSQDSVAMRVAAGRQRRAAGAALRRRRERVREANTRGRERIEARAPDGPGAVATKMAPDVVRRDYDDVERRGLAVRASPLPSRS